MDFTPTRRSVIDDLVFIDAQGSPLPVQVTTYPHEVDIDTSVGRVRLCFSDPETLFFALPPGTIGLRFKVRAARVNIDRRGGTLYGMHNVAYTTDARLLHNEIVAMAAKNDTLDFSRPSARRGRRLGHGRAKSIFGK